MTLLDALGHQDAMVENVLREHDQASPWHREQGERWYHDAHAFAIRIAHHACVGAGVIAALSPNLSWAENKRLASLALVSGQATGTFSRNCVKANRIMRGETPLSVLGGPKVRAFYASIAEPLDPAAVCVDRHALSLAQGHKMDDSERKVIDRVGAYEYVADVYRYAADELDLIPSVVQAITWTSWRARHAWRRGPRIDTGQGVLL